MAYYPQIILLGSVLFFFWFRLQQYLRFLQQEEYDNKRFLKWIQEKGFYDTKATAALVVLFVLSLFLSSFHYQILISLFLLISFVYIEQNEPNPKKDGKITLKLTARAKRIFNTSFVVVLAVYILLFLLCPFCFSTKILLSIIFIQATPLFLCSSVWLLQPGEDKRQADFLNEAKSKFEKIAPKTIGITGSYGKTSTKNMLGAILNSSLAPTFWPAKGINTPMGITRAIRENLDDSNLYAVIEMGAYRPGSIKRLCDFTPPDAGIITAVGRMHLGRMGGDEGVLKAKSELAQAIPENGILVSNADNEGSLKIARMYPKRVNILYTLSESVKLEKNEQLCSLQKKETLISGTKFEIIWEGKSYEGFLSMHGVAALSNFAASFSMACALGADPEYVIAYARNIKPVNNRLEVVSYQGYTQINDAYNSNPAGFLSALEVLRDLPGQRKILLTPGMIDLGDKQHEENSSVARIAADICDKVYIVGDENSGAIIEGLESGGFEEILLVKNREEAFEYLGKDKKEGDVVLIENDLPDLYELDFKL